MSSFKITVKSASLYRPPPFFQLTFCRISCGKQTFSTSGHVQSQIKPEWNFFCIFQNVEENILMIEVNLHYSFTLFYISILSSEKI